MPASCGPVRVAVYGTGSWANRTHIPNLLKLGGVELVAACDASREAVEGAARAHGIPRTYADGQAMVADGGFDVLFSCVPAFARTGVEAAAAEAGVHLFSEKPQATTMAVARRIDAAVRQAGVLSTVCFRERYRPLSQEARRLLAGREIVHVRFSSCGGLPGLLPASGPASWHQDMARSGGSAFDWGVHAVDYIRFVTGLDVATAQAYYHHPARYVSPLSCSFNLRLESGATATLSFVSAVKSAPPEEPWFTFFYLGGYLAIHRYDRLVVDGETAYQAADFDPWLEQDRAFIEAVRTGDGSALLNDYHDGLYSLAPVLAGWESARRGGQLIDMAAFMEA
ncbi:MAG: Gfo/Idh/MocA family oxidoreductase [Gemmatimonadota bacterium]